MNVTHPHATPLVNADAPGDGEVAPGEQSAGRLPAPASRVAPGAVIGGRFSIVAELARGGMGVVYQAADSFSQRTVALKILHPHYARDPVFVAEFFREANAVAQINHPGIVQAYAVGEDDGLCYFAMEYINGQTLKQILAEQHHLAPERALGIVREVNLSLHYAWITQKLIHRDIKPDNIMLTLGDLVILADLGLARKATDLLQGATDNDEVAGTPQYMSPEQILLRPMDCRSDIYSLGATFYHALTGCFPYVGSTLASVAMRHLTVPLTPPHAVAAHVPPAMSRLVEVMMAKRPEHRYPSGEELADDIDRVTRGQLPQFPLAPDSQTPWDLRNVPGLDPAVAAAGTHEPQITLRLTTHMRLTAPAVPTLVPLHSKTPVSNH